MFRIHSTATLAEKIREFWVEAPLVAVKYRAGQFVIIRLTDEGERIPLTVVETKPAEGLIRLIVQEAGKSTHEMCEMKAGDALQDVVGPLGKATHIETWGNLIIIGGGVGAAPVLPMAKAARAAGNKVYAIVGARSKELLILEDEFRASCDKTRVSTDDGSYATKGFVTDVLKQWVAEGQTFQQAIIAGPIPMMAAVAKVTKELGIPAMASLNPVMVDGTGMCGGCRVTVHGKTFFACVDGPEFDAHGVDFRELGLRNAAYKNIEAQTLQRHLRNRRPSLQTDTASRGSAHAWLIRRPQRRNTSTGRAWGCLSRTPTARARNFEEVPFGYTEAQAMAEADRCLMCKKPKCVEGCPVNIDIPAFIAQIRDGDFSGAARTLRSTNSLPAICGRVCPQGEQCEVLCIEGLKHDPIAIGNLERFAADWERENDAIEIPEIPAPTGYKVAVVGSGPAGLTVAGDLAKMGHEVTVFEALHKPSGVLAYGIPEFRLPRLVVKSEIDYIKQLGVKFVYDVVVGMSVTVDELFEQGYQAVFIGTGAGLPKMMKVPGENYVGVYSANEFLTRVNLMGASRGANDTPVRHAKHTVVVGGGNTAMDAARVSLRVSGNPVTLVYRRSMDKIPARKEEIHHAIEEGIKFELLVAPLEVLGNEHGSGHGFEMHSYATRRT